MRNLILILVLAAVSNVAFGTTTDIWVRISGNDDSTSYIQHSQHQVVIYTKLNEMATIWDMTDLEVVHTVDNVNFFSLIMQHEYDCKNEKQRMLTIAAYAKHMGQGKIVKRDDTTSGWQAITLGTKEVLEFNLVCRANVT